MLLWKKEEAQLRLIADTIQQSEIACQSLPAFSYIRGKTHTSLVYGIWPQRHTDNFSM